MIDLLEEAGRNNPDYRQCLKLIAATLADNESRLAAIERIVPVGLQAKAEAAAKCPPLDIRVGDGGSIRGRSKSKKA